MSKFIDRLKQLSEGAPQPIGFRPRGATPEKPKIQLVAAVADASAAERAAGADAVLLDAAGSAPKTDQPWGVRLATASVPDGADFVVLPAEAPLTPGVKEGVGKVLAVGPSLPGDVVRALNGVALDAVLLTAAKESERSLTWIEVVDFHRFAAILSRPLLVEVPAGISGPEIEQVWQAGAAGIVVRVQQMERLQELRAAISALTPPVPPRVNRPVARAPLAPAPRPEEDEEDDE